MNNPFKVKLKDLLITLAIIVITLELSPFIAGSFFLENGYSRKACLEELYRSANPLQDIADSTSSNGDDYLGEHILHPYLGFIHKEDPGYNDYGFPAGMPLVKRKNTEVNLCITGGSVAKQLFQVSGDELKSLLHEHPYFKDKKINLVSVALGGFKQPQQMLAMNYLMSLGAEYDFVINIDGFNEIVLPYSDNLPFRIFPAYPRHWNVYSRKSIQPEIQIILGEQALISAKQQRQSAYLTGSVFRNSNFALFMWKIRDQNLRSGFLEKETLLRERMMASELESQTHGPEYLVSDTSKFLAQQAEYWAQCSRQMNGLAAYFGVSYIHFLQPNQYVEGSKVLTPEEMDIAYEESDFAYKEAVHRGYSFLIREGDSLVLDSVRFFDLTQLFIKESETVYSDKCCHFNEKGYNAIAKEIARAIINEIDRANSSTEQ